MPAPGDCWIPPLGVTRRYTIQNNEGR